MDRSKELEERLFYKLFSKSYVLLLLNLCFIGSLLPLLFLLSLEKETYVWWVFLKLVYVQLVFRGLFQATEQLFLKHQGNIFRTYGKVLLQEIRQNFKTSIIYSFLFLVIGLDMYFVLVVWRQFVLVPLLFSIFLFVWSAFINELLQGESKIFRKKNCKQECHMALRKMFPNFLLLLLGGGLLIGLEQHFLFTLLFCPSVFASIVFKLHQTNAPLKGEKRP